MVLPALTYKGGAKTTNEVHLYYNLGVGQILKRLALNSTAYETLCQGDNCPPNSFNATVLHTVTGYQQDAFGGIPANSPIYTACEGEFNPVNAGVHAYLVCLPNPTNDQLICYDQGFDPSHELTYRPVPRKFNVADHYVLQRANNTIRITDTYVSNFAGLNRVRGRRCTIIAKVYPDGGSNVQEIHYFSNVMLTINPISGNSDGNANIEITGDGNFSFHACFAAHIP